VHIRGTKSLYKLRAKGSGRQLFDRQVSPGQCSTWNILTNTLCNYCSTWNILANVPRHSCSEPSIITYSERPTPNRSFRPLRHRTYVYFCISLPIRSHRKIVAKWTSFRLTLTGCFTFPRHHILIVKSPFLPLPKSIFTTNNSFFEFHFFSCKMANSWYDEYNNERRRSNQDAAHVTPFRKPNRLSCRRTLDRQGLTYPRRNYGKEFI